MSNETYGRRPFISYGMPVDGVRPEVLVSMGRGNIDGVEEKDKNARVSFRTDNLKNPIHGFIPVDSEAFELIRQSKKNREPLFYRIEQIRKPGVDPSIPMAELRESMESARDTTFKRLVAVRASEDDEWLLAGNNATLIEEDHLNENGPAVNPYSLTPEKRAELLGSPAVTVNGSPATANEKKVEPWLVDGLLNLNSDALTVVRPFLEAAQRTYSASAVAYRKDVEYLAVQLLKLANRLQEKAYATIGVDGFKADQSTPSYVQARDFLFSAAESREFDADDVKGWLREVYNEAEANYLFTIAVASELIQTAKS